MNECKNIQRERDGETESIYVCEKETRWEEGGETEKREGKKYREKEREARINYVHGICSYKVPVSIHLSRC